MEPRKVAAGALLLSVSSATALQANLLGSATSLSLALLASLTLAGGSALAGATRGRRSG